MNQHTKTGIIPTIHALLRSARPRQWTKSLAVFLPLFFSVNEAWTLDDPQTACNRLIVELAPTAGGPVRLVASPIDMSAAPFAVRRAPPTLGEHTDEVLAEVAAEDGCAA